MKNYQKLHYDRYYIQNEDGTHLECDRRTCFAPPEEIPGCEYRQRWFYDPEAGYAVRLPRNAQGDAIGRRCKASLKKEERTHEHTAGMVSLDKPRFNDNGDDMGRWDIADDSASVEQIVADMDSLQHLLSILAQLTEDDQVLIAMLSRKAKKAEIAARFRITVDGVRYRELQLRKKILKNPDFQKMFKNL